MYHLSQISCSQENVAQDSCIMGFALQETPENGFDNWLMEMVRIGELGWTLMIGLACLCCGLFVASIQPIRLPSHWVQHRNTWDPLYRQQATLSSLAYINTKSCMHSLHQIWGLGVLATQLKWKSACCFYFFTNFMLVHLHIFFFLGIVPCLLTA